MQQILPNIKKHHKNVPNAIVKVKTISTSPPLGLTEKSQKEYPPSLALGAGLVALEEGLTVLWSGHYCLASLHPVGRAHFTMLLVELNSLHKP